MNARQLALAIDVPQPRARRKESWRLYYAVVALRRKDFPVYRRGRLHLVAGRQMSTRELLRFLDRALLACLQERAA